MIVIFSKEFLFFLKRQKRRQAIIAFSNIKKKMYSFCGISALGKCSGSSMKKGFFDKAWKFNIWKYYISDKVFLAIIFYPRKLAKSRSLNCIFQ